MSVKVIPKVFLVVAALVLFYFFEIWNHKRQRPWAYSEPGLLGKWEGHFNDPDGIAKDLKMEIIEPEMEDNNHDRVHSRRNYDKALEFKGFATVTSKLGVEHHRIVGELVTEDGHSIDNINFVPRDESKQIRESFNLSLSGAGTWQDDVIKVPLIFTYRTKTLSGYSDSSDPRFKKQVPVTLRRTKTNE